MAKNNRLDSGSVSEQLVKGFYPHASCAKATRTVADTAGRALYEEVYYAVTTLGIGYGTSTIIAKGSTENEAWDLAIKRIMNEKSDPFSEGIPEASDN